MSNKQIKNKTSIKEFGVFLRKVAHNPGKRIKMPNNTPLRQELEKKYKLDEKSGILVEVE